MNKQKKKKKSDPVSVAGDFQLNKLAFVSEDQHAYFQFILYVPV